MSGSGVTFSDNHVQACAIASVSPRLVTLWSVDPEGFTMQPGAFDIDARSRSVPVPGPDLAQSLFDAPVWAAYPHLAQAKDLKRCATLIKIHAIVSQPILCGTAGANDLLFQVYSRGVV